MLQSGTHHSLFENTHSASEFVEKEVQSDIAAPNCISEMIPSYRSWFEVLDMSFL